MMSAMRIRTAVAATALALLVVAAPAAAGDRGIVRAYASHAPRLERLKAAADRALNLESSGRRAVARLVRANTRAAAESGRLTADVRPRGASTRKGARAKHCILHEQFWARRAWRNEIAAMYAQRSGDSVRAKELLGTVFVDLVFQLRYEKCRSRALNKLGYAQT
jgi:hypothetical protein